jgi:hypothetical protein
MLQKGKHVVQPDGLSGKWVLMKTPVTVFAIYVRMLQYFNNSKMNFVVHLTNIHVLKLKHFEINLT